MFRFDFESTRFTRYSRTYRSESVSRFNGRAVNGVLFPLRLRYTISFLSFIVFWCTCVLLLVFVCVCVCVCVCLEGSERTFHLSSDVSFVVEFTSSDE
jgi:hypothetical protein